MSEAIYSDAIRFDRVVGAYAEKRDEEPFWLDLALSRLFAGIMPTWVPLPRRAKALVARVISLEDRTRLLSDEGLRAAADELRGRLVAKGFAFDLIAWAFALAREATFRCLAMRQYPVQLLGGAAMLDGYLIEMNTGEGKTITALLPAAAAALAGLPVHVITVNDYLAKRDSELLSPVFDMLGLSVGLIQNGQAPPSRRKAYASDITYCTNKELAFDYLRDRIALGQIRSRTRIQLGTLFSDSDVARKLVLRGLYFCIVDEADSVLIDEARVPLLISSEAGDEADATIYPQALSIASALSLGRHFIITLKERSIELTPAGIAVVEQLTAEFTRPFVTAAARRELIQQALTAVHLFHRDQQYIVTDGKIQIIDEQTGRVMADRFWERGLQQIIEVKESCEPSGRRETLARMTYQRFFSRYLRLAGMSGTLREVASELKSVYHVKATRIPTNRRVLRFSTGTRVYASTEAKWRAVEARVIDLAREGRPVLIGTRSIAASEEIGDRLTRAGVSHVMLNARQDRDEAAIIANAGLKGGVTVATNMAGRGTDIILSKEARDAGGLHVILTEYHESSRIDRQLYGRAGRQGDPGSFEVVASLDDELFLSFVPRLTGMAKALRLPQVPVWFASLLLRLAQRRAERLHERIRRENAKYDRSQERALGFAGQSE